MTAHSSPIQQQLATKSAQSFTANQSTSHTCKFKSQSCVWLIMVQSPVWKSSCCRAPPQWWKPRKLLKLDRGSDLPTCSTSFHDAGLGMWLVLEQWCCLWCGWGNRWHLLYPCGSLRSRPFTQSPISIQKGRFEAVNWYRVPLTVEV